MDGLARRLGSGWFSWCSPAACALGLGRIPDLRLRRLTLGHRLAGNERFQSREMPLCSAGRRGLALVGFPIELHCLRCNRLEVGHERVGCDHESGDLLFLGRL